MRKGGRMERLDYKEKITQMCDKLCKDSNDFTVCYGLCLGSHGFNEKEVIEEVRRVLTQGREL